MGAGLPPDLDAALERALEGQARTTLAERAARMSERYRLGQGSRIAIADETDALAYLVVRLPATYAAVSVALQQAAARAPGFAPASLLDAGSGPGTASWAAADVFPALQNIAMCDASPHLMAMARAFCESSPAKPLREARLVVEDLLRSGTSLPSADLVVAAYVIGELPPAALDDFVLRLWDSCGGLLVLVEPGTPSGYARILAARTRLVAAGAAMLAPCPHTGQCPIAEPDWCHFSARLPRSRDHMLAKGASVPFEDEKFCYLAVARDTLSALPAASRILAPPQRNKAAITLRLCRDGGIAEMTVARRDRADYARLRHARWGDGL